MSAFYRNWLNLWAWGVIAFGAILALFAFPATELPSRLFYDLIQGSVPAEPDRHFRFAMGLMGCISMGWGLTMLTCFKAAAMLEGEQARQIWRGFTFAALFWFVTDSAASIYTGFPLNAVSNMVLTGLYLVPVISSGVLNSQAATGSAARA
jgi:hypothetical protein